MKVKIEDKEYDLRYSIRQFIIYENIYNKSFEIIDLSRYENLVTMVYAVIKSTLKYHKVDFDYTLDTLIDYIEDNGSDKFLIDFANWFIKEHEKAISLVNVDATDEEKEEMSKKTKNSHIP